MKKIKADLGAIVAEVQETLAPILKAEFQKAEEQLAKAQPGEATKPEVPADESATKPEDKSASKGDDKSASPPADASASPPPAADKSASPPPADAPPAPPADAPPAGDASASGDPAADMSSDPAELQQAYATLPLEELQMHYLAVKSALIAAMGNDASADAPPVDAPPAPGASAAPPPAAPPAPPPAQKAELKVDEKANGQDPTKLGKSEKDILIEALQKKAAEQETALASLVNAMTKVIETPVRKSVTSVSEIKTDSTKVDVSKLSKGEIKTRLKRAAEKQTLSKSDRERINLFALGHIEVEGIADLIS